MQKLANQIADICITSLRAGNKIMFCGNGGSAADSQHLAAELVGKLNFDRPPLAAMSLTVDTSVITAIGNDYGYEKVFSRQIEALGKSGDVLVAISTSGNSRNVIEAIMAAKKLGITVIAMTGDSGGAMANMMCNAIYKAPFESTQRIQECHIIIGHKFCELIEEKMFPKASSI